MGGCNKTGESVYYESVPTDSLVDADFDNVVSANITFNIVPVEAGLYSNKESEKKVFVSDFTFRNNVVR